MLASANAAGAGCRDPQSRSNPKQTTAYRVVRRLGLKGQGLQSKVNGESLPAQETTAIPPSDAHQTVGARSAGYESQCDEALLDAYKNGEAAAFRALIERYRDSLLRFLIRFVGDRATAEDAFQEAFLQVHVSIDSFDPARSFRPWLYTIAANKARDLLRKKARRPALELSAPIGKGNDRGFVDLMEHSSAPIGQRLDDAERDLYVQKAVNAMPEHLKEILLLAYFQRLSYQQVAEALGIPLGTVKSRLHAAVASFAKAWRTSVEGTGFDDEEPVQ